MARITFKMDKTFNSSSTAQINKALKSEVTDLALDLRMVSQSLTPRSTGKLERSATSKVSKRGDVITGTVGYSATSTRGYNYAKKMHDGAYTLGKESRRKRAIKSKFARGTLRVGPGFLVKTAQQSTDGYVKHLRKQTAVAIQSSKILKGR